METTATTPSTIDKAVMEKKRIAWGNLGVQIYEQELLLQARSQQSLAKIKTPKKIEEVAAAEITMKEVKADCASITNERKSITSKFDDVSKRLMEPEKSFIEPLEALERAIIALKKDDEDRQRKDREKQTAITKCREFLTFTRNNADALFKNKILDKVNKVYEHALGAGEIDMNMLPDFIKFAITRMSDLDFKIEYPLNTFSAHVSADDYIKMCHEILIIKAEPYLAQYENDLRAKFSDYEVALKNKEQAIALSKQEKDFKAQEIKEVKANADTAATLSSIAAATPLVTSGRRALKQIYEIDMPETVESVIAIMGAFTANLSICLPKLKVNKWFSFTPSQAAIALAKVKCDDNNFQPTGLIFKQVDKL